MYHSSKTDRDTLAQLRARIARIERAGSTETTPRPLGVPAIDGALPWGGLPRGALHEVFGITERDLAAQGFAAMLSGVLAQENRGRQPVFWIAPDEGPYPPSLPGFGLDPAQVTTVRTHRPVDTLWALEEAIRCPALAAVIAEGARPDFAQSRRLQLAASESGVSAILLQPAVDPLPSSAAVTRWRVAAAPSAADGAIRETVGNACWRLELLRCRGGRSRNWQVEWNHETHHLAVAADARDRSDRASSSHEAARPKRQAA